MLKRTSKTCFYEKKSFFNKSHFQLASQRNHIQPENIKIPVSDNIKLDGLVNNPKGSAQQNIRLIILVHGFAAEKTENGLFSEVSSKLTENGYFVIQYDWRGLGNSEGDFVEANLKTHINDFKKVVQWIEESISVSCSEICAVGFSLGATIVAKAIADGLKFGAASFWSPAIRPSVAMWPRYNTEDYKKQLISEGFITKSENKVKIGKAILESLRKTDIHNSIFKTNIPLLVCHGSNDMRIPIDETRKAFNNIGSRNQRIQNPVTEQDLVTEINNQTVNFDDINIYKRKKVFFAEFNGASHSFRPEQHHWNSLIKILSIWLEGNSLERN